MQELFAVLVVAVVDGGADVFSCFGELFVVWRGRVGGVEQFVEFAASVLEVDELGAQVADPVAALGLGEGAGFEREQVAFDGLFSFGDVGIGLGQFALVLGAVGGAACRGLVGDAVEQVTVGVEGEDAVEGGGVEFTGGEPVAVAGVGA